MFHHNEIWPLAWRVPALAVARSVERHGSNAPGSAAGGCRGAAAAFFAVVTALGIMIHGVGTAVEQRRSRGQLPPGPQSTETGLARAYRGC